jgi:hypothetical protein
MRAKATAIKYRSKHHIMSSAMSIGSQTLLQNHTHMSSL